MLKKFIFFISLFFFSNITVFLSAEIIPLKKPLQTKEEKDQKLLIDVMKPLPKPTTKKVVEEIEKSDSSRPFTAYFICSLILYWPDNHFEKFEGKIYGEIIWPGRGEKGHGYDPIFLPNGYKETFGQMDRWKKNKISHRGLAMDNLLNACF